MQWKTCIKLSHFWKTHSMASGLSTVDGLCLRLSNPGTVLSIMDTFPLVLWLPQASVSFSGSQISYSQRHHKMNLFPNSCIMFLQNASASEDQLRIATRNT